MPSSIALPRCTPAQAGLDAQHILDFINACEEKHLHLNSLMLLRHGKVLFEAYYAPYCPAQLQTVYSLS